MCSGPSITGVDEEVGAFNRVEEVEEFADALPEGVDRALLGFAQVGFEFGDGLLDRVEVGRIEPAPAKVGGGR